MANKLNKAIDWYNLKLETLNNILFYGIDQIIRGEKRAEKAIRNKRYQEFKKTYFKNGIWDFNGIKLPDYKETSNLSLFHCVFMDSLFVYCCHNDNYDSSLVDLLDKYLPEGTYGYKNQDINVTVKKNDVVIDAGAWIGDFSAYASIKGAKVYAFEPSKINVGYLKKTQEMNQNIHIVEKGLGDQSGIFLLTNDTLNTGANKIIEDNNIGTEKIELTTIDEFVEINKLDKIDFIKSDIEGYERNMLAGAKKRSKNLAQN